MEAVLFKDWEAKAEYTPLNRFMSCGTEIQVSSLMFPNNTRIIERTFFPWNIFKSSTTFWVLDLVLPVGMTDDVKKFDGVLSDNYYTDEGYGMPEFTNLNQAFDFNEHYHSKLK
jgi:hypothetical protein